MDKATKTRLLAEYRNAPRLPSGAVGAGGRVPVSPEVARERYAECLMSAEKGDCVIEEIAGSEGRMIAVRASLGGIRGPLHRCDACGCVLELRVLTGARCPKGKW